MKKLVGFKNYFHFRWDQTPISEAMRHRHPQIVGYMKRFREEHPHSEKEGSPYEVVYDRGVTTI